MLLLQRTRCLSNPSVLHAASQYLRAGNAQLPCPPHPPISRLRSRKQSLDPVSTASSSFSTCNSLLKESTPDGDEILKPQTDAHPGPKELERKKKPPYPPSRHVYIRGLPTRISGRSVRTKLKKVIGDGLEELHIPQSKSGNALGYAYLNFETVEAAQAFVDTPLKNLWKDDPLTIRFTTPRSW